MADDKRAALHEAPRPRPPVARLIRPPSIVAVRPPPAAGPAAARQIRTLTIMAVQPFGATRGSADLREQTGQYVLSESRSRSRPDLASITIGDHHHGCIFAIEG